MTREEAEIVAQLIGYADGGCANCVGDLVRCANRMLPQFVWSVPDRVLCVQERYINEYHMEAYDDRIVVDVKEKS